MKEIITTADGSHTIAIPELRLTYHSVHGAIQESNHVFIQAGLLYQLTRYPNSPIAIFEMGFGTGLNALLTASKAAELDVQIQYTSIENAPLSLKEAGLLNYGYQLGQNNLFNSIHECAWNKEVELTNHFTLHKIESDLWSYSPPASFNLIYYDAFAPSAQPALWTKDLFEKLFLMLQPAGVLVTYCAKGDVRRAMLAAGFAVEKLPGPKGKREMLRASKVL